MRVTSVKKADRDAGTCIHCFEVVPKGEPYQWVRAYRGPKRVIHEKCAPFRPSETASNDKVAEAYSIQEAMEDASFEDLEDAESQCQSWAEDIRAVAEQYQEVASNIEDGFGHETEGSMEATDNADQLEAWADTVERATEGIEWPGDFDEWIAENEELTEADHEEAKTAALSEISEQVSNAAMECPL